MNKLSICNELTDQIDFVYWIMTEFWTLKTFNIQFTMRINWIEFYKARFNGNQNSLKLKNFYDSFCCLLISLPSINFL